MPAPEEQKVLKAARNKRKKENKKAKKVEADEKEKEEKSLLAAGESSSAAAKTGEDAIAGGIGNRSGNGTGNTTGVRVLPIPEVTLTNHSTLGIKVASSPNKRLGLFATQAFSPGAWILREKPLVYSDSTFLGQEVCAKVLSKEHRKRFDLLHKACICNDRVCRETIASKVWSSCGMIVRFGRNLRANINAGPGPDIGGIKEKENEQEKKEEQYEDLDENGWPKRVAVYETVSRINHACEPNVVCAFTPACEVALQVVRRIRKGEEITRSYLPASQMKDWKEILPRYFGFNCECDECLSKRTPEVDFDIEGAVQQALDELLETTSGNEPDTEEEKKFRLAHIWAWRTREKAQEEIREAIKEIEKEALQPHSPGSIVEKCSRGTKLGEIVESHRRYMRENNEFGLSEKAITQNARMVEEHTHEYLIAVAKDEEKKAVERVLAQCSTEAKENDEHQSGNEEEVQERSEESASLDLDKYDVATDDEETILARDESKSLGDASSLLKESHIAKVDEKELNEHGPNSGKDRLESKIESESVKRSQESIPREPKTSNVLEEVIEEVADGPSATHTSKDDREDGEVDDHCGVHDKGKGKEKEIELEPIASTDVVEPPSTEQPHKPRWVILKRNSDDSSDSSSDSSSEDSNVIAIERDAQDLDSRNIQQQATVEENIQVAEPVLRLLGKVTRIVYEKEGESSAQGASSANEARQVGYAVTLSCNNWETLVAISKLARGRVLL